MAFNIVVPPLSESVVEATVSEWQKKVGDTVHSGDVIVVLETDKVSLEVTAEGDGVLSQISHPEGDDVKAGDVLGMIDGQASAVDSAPQPDQVAAPAPTQPNGTSTAVPAAANLPTEAPAASVPGSAPADLKASPVAKRVAEANQVDIGQVPPRDGSRVMKADVVDHLNRQSVPPAATPASAMVPAARPAAAPLASMPLLIDNTQREERIKLSRRRRTIASRLVQANTEAAMLTTFNEVDMSAVMDLRSRRKEAFQKKYGVGLGFSSFFVKATIGALKVFPLLNAELDGDSVIKKNYYDIGMAIGAEEGLVVPVLRNADQMSFADIEKKIKEYAEQVKTGSLALEALLGGTFSITNGGVYGSLMSTPILNFPQVGILGLHGIKERPIVLNGAIVARPMMYTALTYDHRIVDGKEAVQFLVKIKELIEDPETLLIEG